MGFNYVVSMPVLAINRLCPISFVDLGNTIISQILFPIISQFWKIMSKIQISLGKEE